MPAARSPLARPEETTWGENPGAGSAICRMVTLLCQSWDVPEQSRGAQDTFPGQGRRWEQPRDAPAHYGQFSKFQKFSFFGSEFSWFWSQNDQNITNFSTPVIKVVA